MMNRTKDGKGEQEFNQKQNYGKIFIFFIAAVFLIVTGWALARKVWKMEKEHNTNDVASVNNPKNVSVPNIVSAPKAAESNNPDDIALKITTHSIPDHSSVFLRKEKLRKGIFSDMKYIVEKTQDAQALAVYEFLEQNYVLAILEYADEKNFIYNASREGKILTDRYYLDHGVIFHIFSDNEKIPKELLPIEECAFYSNIYKGIYIGENDIQNFSNYYIAMIILHEGFHAREHYLAGRPDIMPNGKWEEERKAIIFSNNLNSIFLGPAYDKILSEMAKEILIKFDLKTSLKNVLNLKVVSSIQADIHRDALAKIYWAKDKPKEVDQLLNRMGIIAQFQALENLNLNEKYLFSFQRDMVARAHNQKMGK